MSLSAAEAAAPLALRLLGPVLVRSRGHDLRIPSHKALVLLCYLAMHPGTVHSRASLAALLWEDSPEREGRNSLSTALSQLRQVLPIFPLHADADTLSWAPVSGVWVDAHVLQAVADDPASTPEQLDAAVSLWRGLLLDGLAVRTGEVFEDWLRQERQVWEQRQLGLLARLIRELERRGEWARAIPYAQQAIALDPLQERFHRALMTLHARLGDRAAALRQYRQCRQLLENELGAKPDAQTVALAEAISAGRLGAAGLGPQSAQRPEPRLRPPASPLMGRQTELDALWRHLGEAARGQRRLVVLEGEAGIGKSRLLEELLWRLQRGGWRPERWTVLLGHSYEAEQSLAFRPFVEALGRALPQLDVRQLGLPEVWLAEVNRLLPDLAELYPRLPDPPRLDPRQEQRRLLEGVARFISALPGPLLLALEDLHWADEGSQAQLGYLLRYESPQPLLVVATARPEDRDPALERLLRSLEREGRLAWLRVGRLSADATRQLVTALLSQGAESIGQRVYEQTEGNPLFAVETVRSLLEDGAIQPIGGLDAERLVIPESVQAVIEARLERLEPPARDLLNAIAIFRRGIDFKLARQVSGQPEEVALDALETLLRAHLLRESRKQGAAERALAGPQTLYRFSHGMIQQVVYDRLSAARRAVLHRRALDGLERLETSGLAEPLAYHAVRAQDWERGAYWSEVAAAEAIRLSAFSAALLLYQQVLDCLAHLPASEANRRRAVDARLALAEVAFYFRPGELAHWLEAAEREAELLGDQQRLASVWLQQARACYIAGAFGRALPMLNRLRPLAEASGDATLLARCESMLGRLLVIRGEHRRGVELIQQALPRLASNASALDLTATTGLLATGLALMGEFEQAQAVAASLLPNAARAGDPAVDAVAHFYVALVHHTRGEWEELERHATRALERAREAGSAIYEYLSLVYLGRAQAFLHSISLGIETQERALAAAEQARTRAILGRAHAWLADLYRRAGRLEDARRHAELGRVIADEEGVVFESALCARVLGETLLDAGDLDAAARLLGESRDLLIPLEARPELCRVDLALAHLAERREQRAEATALYERARAELAQMGMRGELELAQRPQP